MSEQQSERSPASPVNTEMLRVLVVEDSPADAELIERELTKAGFEVTARRVQTAEEVAERLRAEPYDLVLADYGLPGWTGMDVVDLVRQEHGDLPVILVTGSLGDELAVDCVRRGAADYVLKDHLARLPVVVARVLQETKAQRARARAERVLQERERRLASIYDTVGDVIFHLEVEQHGGYRFISVNKAFVTTTGIDSAQVEGKLVNDVVPEPSLTLVLEKYREAVRDKKIVRWEETSDYPTGRLTGEVSVAPVVDDAGNCTHLVGAVHDTTERKRAEEGLKLFRTLLDRSNDAIEVTDPRTARFLDVNEKACLDLGYSREELLSLTAFDVNPTFSPSELATRVDEIERSGGLLREGIHRRKDGSTFPVEVNLSLVRLERDYIVTVVRDITERKRAEEALRDSEARYRGLFEQAGASIRLVDPETGCFLAFNEKAHESLGYTREEFAKLSLREIEVVESTEDVTRRLDRIMREGSDIFETRHRRKDGEVRDVLVSAHVVSVGGKRLIQGLTQDITELKRAERERTRLGAAVEQTTDSIVITDADGTIQYVNTAFEHTTGYERAEVIGQNPRILKSGKHDAIFYRAIWDSLARGEPWKGTFVNRKKDGTLYEEDQNIFRVADAAENTVNYVSIGRDLTGQRALESRLHQAQKMEAIGRLAGGVAHDFNNVLTAILGNTDLLLDTVQAGDARRQDLEEIRKAATRAATLIRQLLAYSRRQVLQPRVLDLNVVVADVEKMLRRLIGEHIEFRTVLAPGLGAVRADPGQLEQILLNLAVNARDAMPRGGALTIETANADLDATYHDADVAVQPGPYVMLAVSDTGIGIDEETSAHLFEPFFTTKERGQGTGLGLATVYGVVKQSGGHIWVDSEAGQGARFKIYFPRIDAIPEPAEPRVTPAPRTGSATVLVAEDEDPVRRITTRMLKSLGYTVLAAASGHEALELAARHDDAIHLLITDMVMPRMSGPELAERLAVARPGIRVLYVSGYASGVSVYRGVLERGVPFLQKPFTPDALAAKVRDVLEAP